VHDVPLVSVIAICFNHERWVTECLDSIAAQDHPNIQLIILDDCSTDGSVRVIREWLARTGAPARFIEHPMNVGICASRNDALRHATGDYVACISTDDTWVPHKLSSQVAILESLPRNVGLVYGDAYRMDENGIRLPGMQMDMAGAWLGFSPGAPPSGDVYDELLRGSFIPGMTTLIRRSVFDAVGPYDESLAYEDWDMWLRIAQQYEVAFAAGPWATYRSMLGTLSDTLGTRGIESSIALLRKHLGQSPARDAVIGDQIGRFAIELHLRGAAGSVEQLDAAVLVDRRRWTRAVRMTARAGLPGPWLAPVVRLSRRVRGALGRSRAS
jgi:glycosyltransferase involved in cell wall biosynthesis